MVKLTRMMMIIMVTMTNMMMMMMMVAMMQMLGQLVLAHWSCIWLLSNVNSASASKRICCYNMEHRSQTQMPASASASATASAGGSIKETDLLQTAEIRISTNNSISISTSFRIRKKMSKEKWEPNLLIIRQCGVNLDYDIYLRCTESIEQPLSKRNTQL